MKILAFGGSSSRHSINKQFATYATTFFEGSDIQIIDLNDFEMPIFSVDKEAENGHPDAAKKFVQLIGDADFLIVSLAEHNGSYSAAFKNILDWSSRILGKTFQGKPMLLMATSTGARGGRFVLDAAITRFPIHDAKLLGTYSLPEFNKTFSSTDGIINEELLAAFKDVIEEVKKKLEG